MGWIPYVVALSVLALYLLRNRYSRGLNRFDGPFLASVTNLWKIWNVCWFNMPSSRNELYVDLHRTYGDVVRIGPRNLSFADPQAIPEIYGTKGSQIKSEMYDTFSVGVKGVQQPNLLSSRDGNWHDQQRRAINPAFNLSSLLKYEPWVDDTIDLLQQQLSKRAAEHQRGSKKTVDLHRWLAFFAADVISNLTYGQRTGFLETGADVEGIQATVRAVFRFWLFFSQMPILDKWTFKNPLLMWALRHGFLEIKIPHAEIVQRHVDQRKTVWEENQKNGDGSCTTLVDSFLMAERDNRGKIEISPNDLAFGMVTAGSESTSITLSSVFYILLKNPRCYAKLQEEVDSTDIAQDKKPHSSSSVYSWATTQNMPYLDACIREAMRLHPAQRIPQDRMVSKGGLIVRGHRIPEGTDIGVFSSVLHRRLEVFGDDADTYRPERWLTDDQEKKTQMKNSMFTFGHGKYNCMGKNISKMEMYKVIPTLIKNFTLRLPDLSWEWTLNPGALTAPKELPVYLEVRCAEDR